MKRLPPQQQRFAEPQIMAALLAYAMSVWAIGFSVPTVALLLWMLYRRAGMRAWTGALYGLVVFGVIHLLFSLLRGDAPVGAILPLG